MKYYSQNKEEQIILDYFKDFKGTVLDLGANDGITLSNSYRVLQNGWNGVLVEASPKTFLKLIENHANTRGLAMFNYAVSDEEGMFKFHESGSHLGNGDTSLLSTLSDKDKKKWEKTTTWEEVEVVCKKFDFLLKESQYKTFDLITIDIEGKDWAVLQQMDLDQLGCKMLIIEHNGSSELKALFINYCHKFGMSEIHSNSENIIFTK